MPPIGPLERGLAVLRALAAAPGGRMAASGLAKETGLARSPVDRIAATLIRLGYVREEVRELVLAPPLLCLGEAYLRSAGIAAALDPLAARLADELDESVSVAVPDGDDAVRFVVQHTRRRALSVSFRVGDVLPADRCAPGPLFAAAQREWAVDDQLIEPGLVAVAVPVRDPEGRTAYALSAVSHTSRHSAEDLREHALEPLRRTAAAMTAALAAGGAEAAPEPVTDPTPDAKRELGPEYLQSLARGLAVLAALGQARGGMTLAAVARATGLSRATVRRSLLSLVELGYVAGDDGRFAPLPRVLDLGYPLLSALSLDEIARPHLAELVRQVHESASMAVLDGPDIRYVSRVAASRIMSVTITTGTRFPAYATSMGRVLLAGLPAAERLPAGLELKPLTAYTITDRAALGRVIDTVAGDGYAVVDQELEKGLRSVAAPVRGADGSVVAAVNVALHAGRTTEAEARDAVLPALRETAARISADVAAVRPASGTASPAPPRSAAAARPPGR
ncbi:helix-turn-helix domain-containing protein [Streptomyces sp. A7024]|uniref:Helix-turn-helix domain-containing protein n=1 Tax=Streptomyces coryli TaxID=1128680 RepID=A0A6G4U1L2_9ACTN|nr:IclR family transcriptional regulator C-terminal domain-containing protein [Streptomyces coryli]NGN65640.1 helix-turn-helix domain-containing protein [Streptomyces coryli]